MDDETKMGLRERPSNLLTVPVMDRAMDSGAGADGFVHAVADPTIIMYAYYFNYIRGLQI
jgi:hypothetical protein